MIVLQLALMASIAQAAPATQPTPKAAARAEQLKAGMKTFTLKHVIDPKETPFWMGKVTTKAVAVEIVPKVQP